MFRLIFYIFQGWKNFIAFRFFNKDDKPLYKNRLLICVSCKDFRKLTRQCKFCGCFLDAKTHCDFELDENNKAIYSKDSSGNIIYSCHLQKW